MPIDDELRAQILRYLELPRFDGHLQTVQRRCSQWAKTHPPYAPEFRRQMVELVRSGRSAGGAGTRVRVLCADDP